MRGRVVQRKDVQRAMRALGFRRAPGGIGGHQIWRDAEGRTLTPPLRRADIPIEYVYAIGDQIAGVAGVSRRDFVAAVLGRGE